MAEGLLELLEKRRGEQFALHDKHMNSQMVKVLQTIGYNRQYVRAEGSYLFDHEGHKYLDLLSGFGTFALGRNHPTVSGYLKEVLDAQMPNMVQMDVSLMSGLLGEELLSTMPSSLDKVFFCNSGAETVEGAIKFARGATGRERMIFCDHAFHGLTNGALSLNGDKIFREGFGSLLPNFTKIPFNDLAALEKELAQKNVAAFIVEPIQGKGVNLPDGNYLKDAQELCHKYGALFIADEVQTGLGRTGKMWAVEHWGVEPDMLLTAKALSGGHIPVGAVAMRKWIFDKVFNRMDRAVVHGSTFSKNNMAMAAGLATLKVLKEEKLVENASKLGEQIMNDLTKLKGEFELVKDVRGKGLMIAIEFGSPKSLKLKAAFAMLEAANKGLFCQMVTIPLFKKHRVLSQVAGHGMNIVKLLPPLVLNQDDRQWIANSFRDAVADCHKVPGAIWELGTTLAGHALKARKENAAAAQP